MPADATMQPGSGPAGDGSPTLLSKLEHSDLLEQAVPASRRDGPVKMGLLWVTFQASVSGMYTGFLARSAGMSLGDVLWACVIGVAVMVGYGLLAANVGTVTGQPHSVLARGVLGKSGSALASLLLVVTGMGWYGFQAVFLAQLYNGLFGLTHLEIFCAIFAIVMITNNLLGFRSVSGYARLIAAPVLLAWAATRSSRRSPRRPGPGCSRSRMSPATQGILLTAELLIGVAMFGNEPDIWRYARRYRSANILPLGFGYGLGMAVFTVAGYLMAELSSASSLSRHHALLHQVLPVRADRPGRHGVHHQHRRAQRRQPVRGGQRRAELPARPAAGPRRSSPSGSSAPPSRWPWSGRPRCRATSSSWPTCAPSSCPAPRS